MENVLVTV